MQLPAAALTGSNPGKVVHMSRQCRQAV